MSGQYGDNLYLSTSLQRNRWYCLEQRVKMNTPGVRNGVLQGWIDGQLLLNRTDIRFRDSSTVGGSTKIQEMWWNIYQGGEWTADRNMSIHFDNAVIARNRVGCAGSAPAPAPSPIPDTTVPMVSLTSPAASATVSGALTVSAA